MGFPWHWSPIDGVSTYIHLPPEKLKPLLLTTMKCFHVRNNLPINNFKAILVAGSFRLNI